MSDDEIERAAILEIIEEARKVEESLKPPPKVACVNKRLLSSSLASTLRNPVLPLAVRRRRYVGLDDVHFDEDEDEKKRRPDDGQTYDPGADYIYDARKYFNPEKYREIVANRRIKEEKLKEREELVKLARHSRSQSSSRYYASKSSDLYTTADGAASHKSHSLSPRYVDDAELFCDSKHSTGRSYAYSELHLYRPFSRHAAVERLSVESHHLPLPDKADDILLDVDIKSNRCHHKSKSRSRHSQHKSSHKHSKRKLPEGFVEEQTLQANEKKHRKRKNSKSLTHGKPSKSKHHRHNSHGQSSSAIFTTNAADSRSINSNCRYLDDAGEYLKSSTSVSHDSWDNNRPLDRDHSQFYSDSEPDQQSGEEQASVGETETGFSDKSREGSLNGIEPRTDFDEISSEIPFPPKSNSPTVTNDNLAGNNMHLLYLDPI